MAGKQKNMFGGFGAAAVQRREQQEKIEAAVTGKPVSGVPTGREKKRATMSRRSPSPSAGRIRPS